MYYPCLLRFRFIEILETTIFIAAFTISSYFFIVLEPGIEPIKQWIWPVKNCSQILTPADLKFEAYNTPSSLRLGEI